MVSHGLIQVDTFRSQTWIGGRSSDYDRDGAGDLAFRLHASAEVRLGAVWELVQTLIAIKDPDAAAPRLQRRASGIRKRSS
jgi:hypothetical protein